MFTRPRLAGLDRKGKDKGGDASFEDGGTPKLRDWVAYCPAAGLYDWQAEIRAEDRRRADRRARQRLRRYIRGNNLKLLLTFTVGGKFPTAMAAAQAVASFMHSPAARRLLLGKNPSPYLFVVEPHKDGGYHAHMAVRERFIPYRDVINLWTAHLIRKGYPLAADTTCHRFSVGDPDTSKRTRSARECAYYMAKYLGKTFEDQGEERDGNRRFTRSTGFEVVATRSVQRGSTEEILSDLPYLLTRFLALAADANGEITVWWAEGRLDGGGGQPVGGLAPP